MGNKYTVLDSPELENKKVACLTLDVEQDFRGDDSGIKLECEGSFYSFPTKEAAQKLRVNCKGFI